MLAFFCAVRAVLFGMLRSVINLIVLLEWPIESRTEVITGKYSQALMLNSGLTPEQLLFKNLNFYLLLCD